jgi:hypothetical protein
LEKNKDPLNDTAINVLKGAKGNQLLLDIWADFKTQEETAKEEKSKGISSIHPSIYYYFRKSRRRSCSRSKEEGQVSIIHDSVDDVS